MLIFRIRISEREIPDLQHKRDGAKRNQRDLPLKTSPIMNQQMSMFALTERD